MPLIFLGIILFSLNQAFAQCDSLLSKDASINVVCANEWVDLDLSTFEYRKSGNWSSDLPNLKGSNIEGYLLNSSYLVYTYTDASSSCSAKDSIYLKVNPIPEIKIETHSDVCWNEPCFPLTFIATPFGGTWFDTVKSAKKYISSGNFCANQTPKLSTAARYGFFYAYKNPITQCSDTVASSINVKPLPSVDLKIDNILFSIKDKLIWLDSISTGNSKGVWKGIGVLTRNDSTFFEVSLVDTNDIWTKYLLFFEIFDKNGTPPYCSNSDTLIIRLTKTGITTFIQKVGKYKVDIYPNPSTGQVQIQTTNPVKISIYNTNGALVYNDAIAKSQFSIRLEDGLYWAVLKDNFGKQSIEKIIVY